MFRRTPNWRRRLARVTREFGRIHDMPATTLDLEQERDRLRCLVDRDVPKGPIDQIAALELAAELDKIVIGWVAERESHVQRANAPVLRRLDRLAAEVEGIVKGVTALVTDQSGTLEEDEGVTANAWDQAGQPDLPHVDPVRRAED